MRPLKSARVFAAPSASVKASAGSGRGEGSDVNSNSGERGATGGPAAGEPARRAVPSAHSQGRAEQRRS
jgi:hypothetical protein